MHTCTDRYERAVDSSTFVSVFVYDYIIPLSIFTEKFSETFLCLTEFLSGESQRWPYHRCDSLVFATQRIHIRWVAKTPIAATRWATRRCDEVHRSTVFQCSDVQSAATISSLLIVSRSDLRRCDLHIRVAAYLQRHEYVLIASLRWNSSQRRDELITLRSNLKGAKRNELSRFAPIQSERSVTVIWRVRELTNASYHDAVFDRFQSDRKQHHYERKALDLMEIERF